MPRGDFLLQFLRQPRSKLRRREKFFASNNGNAPFLRIALTR
jgi:hypothetical protein